MCTSSFSYQAFCSPFLYVKIKNKAISLLVLNKSTNDRFRLLIRVDAGSQQRTKTPVTKVRYRVISLSSKSITGSVGLNLKGTFLGLKSELKTTLLELLSIKLSLAITLRQQR